MAMPDIFGEGFNASPIAGGLGLFGLGAMGYGALSSFGNASALNSATAAYTGQVASIAGQENTLFAQNAAESMRQAKDAQNINAINQQYMELSNQRAQTENLRRAQMASASSAAGAAASGTQFGSGAAGAQGGIRSQEARNALGLSQGLQAGRDIFSQNQDISQSRIAQFGIESNVQQLQTQLQTAQAYYQQAQGQYQTKESTSKGISSFGGSLLSAAPALMKLLPALML